MQLSWRLSLATGMRQALAGVMVLIACAASVSAAPVRGDVVLTAQQLVALRTASMEAAKKVRTLQGYSAHVSERGDSFVISFVYGDPLASVRGSVDPARPTVEVVLRKRDGVLLGSSLSR